MTSVNIFENRKTVSVIESNTKTVRISTLGPQGPGGALGLYANVADLADQPLASANVAQALQLGVLLESRGISIESGTRIKFALSGVYKIFVSLQLANFANAIAEVNLFFKKNQQELADTNTRIDLQPRKSQAVPYHDYFAIEIQVQVEKDDFVEMYWVADRLGPAIETLPANGTHPQTPSVILNVAQVLYSQAGVPIGGEEGQILEKAGAGNYETAWTDRLTLLEQRVEELEQLLP